MRPLGAISTSVGRVSPEIAVVWLKPAGSVTAPAGAVTTSATKHTSTAMSEFPLRMDMALPGQDRSNERSHDCPFRRGKLEGKVPPVKQRVSLITLGVRD